MSALQRWGFRLAHAGPGRPVAGMRLAVGEGLEAVTLEDPAGAPLGVALGFPIDLAARRFARGAWRVPVAAEEGPDAVAEAALAGLGGPVLLVLDVAGARSVRPDAVAQIPCVRDRRTGEIAGSAAQLLSAEDYDARFDRDLFAAADIDANGWLPAGLTPHADVERLLPDHAFDLGPPGPVADPQRRVRLPGAGPERDPGSVIDTLADMVERQTSAATATGRPVFQTLTGGSETRALLALHRRSGRAADLTFLTIVGGGQYRRDAILARSLARGLGLRHETLPVRRATQQRRDAYVRRTGAAVADANAWTHPTLDPLDGAILLIGLGGEIGRGYVWQRGDGGARDGATLARVLRLPTDPRIVAALDAWAAPLADLPRERFLDLLYLENRMGPWASVQFPAHPGPLRLSPMLAQPAVDALLALPAAMRAAGDFPVRVVERVDPGLLRWRINRLGPVRERLQLLWRIVTEPRYAARRLRETLTSRGA